MYVPSLYAPEGRAQVIALIRAHGFATLVTCARGVPEASHLPLLHVEDGSPHGKLLGHMARANPQWRDFTGEALAVFAGPHAYVSPTMYVSPQMVPTWNYAVVHAYGAPRVLDDAGARDVLDRLVAFYEASRPAPWAVSALDETYAGQLVKAIVAFEIPIARVQGKWKVGQNREAVDRLAAADALAAGGEDDRAIAALMREVDPG